MIQQYRALTGQTIYDIVLMTYGSMDKLFKLMQDNSFPGVNTYPTPGTYFAWDDTLVLDSNVSQTNSLNSINYSTRSSGTGVPYYGVGETSNPSMPPPELPPIVVPPGTGTFFYVYPNSTGISADGSGNFVYTDPRLIGLTGYPVFATQMPAALNDIQPYMTFDPVAGSFTIKIPDFALVDGYKLIVFTSGYTYVQAGDPNITADVSGNFVYTNSILKGLTNFIVYSTQLSNQINTIGQGVTFNPGAGAITIKIPQFSIVVGYRLILFANLISFEI